MKMRKILITNDDGIQAGGLIRLAMAAQQFGEVTVIAPDSERSANSHKITIRDPITVREADFPVEGVVAYESTGTPVDCVRFGLLNFVHGADLVLSGINRGYNSGTDIQYSATVGAALEAACVGVHAIALSEGFGDCHEVTDDYLKDIIADLMDRPLAYNQIWNVNFPDCRLYECKGIIENRTVAGNSFYRDEYVEERCEDGSIRLCVHGTYYEDAADGTDVRAIIDRYVSVGIVNNLR